MSRVPYDFVSYIDRRRAGSEKWNLMLDANPDIPEGIVPLSVADMELRNPPEIIEGLKEYLDGVVLGYSCPTPSYREAVCGWMSRRHGWKVSPEWIVESNGVVPALHAAVKAYTGPGDGVIILTPVYYPFFGAVEANGRKLIPVDLVLNGGRYEMDFDAIRRHAAEASTKLLILCSPHNPVGRVWTRDELAALAEICLDNGLTTVSDEIHFDIVLPGHRHTVLSTLSDEIAERTVVCTSPSKTFNLAGMQTSNIIVKNPDLRKRLETSLYSMCIQNLNTLGYRACEIAYTRCDAWLDGFLGLLAANRDFAEDFLRKRVPAIKALPLEGTYLQWWDCRGLGMGHEELEEFMTKRALLFLDEGHIFGTAGRGFERINLACPTAVLEAALERLALVLEKK